MRQGIVSLAGAGTCKGLRNKESGTESGGTPSILFGAGVAFAGAEPGVAPERIHSRHTAYLHCMARMRKPERTICTASSASSCCWLWTSFTTTPASATSPAT